MKNRFGEKITLNIYTTDSSEALQYKFKSSTNVLFEGDSVPLDTALDIKKMEIFLLGKLS